MNNPERYITSDSVSENFYHKAGIISSLIPRSGVLLDLGCLDGSLARLFKGNFKGKSIGADYVLQHKAIAVFDLVISCEMEKVPLPFKDESVDCVFLGEVIEHIYDTDFLILQIHRILKKGAFLVLTTPNLASLLNRFLLLFGLQPVETEVSKVSCKFGNKFNPDKIPVGHIRNFTYRALKDFLQFYSFKIVKMNCVPSSRRQPVKSIERLAGIISPELGGDLIVKAVKSVK